MKLNLFISHRELRKDHAEQLIVILQTAFGSDLIDITCTSSLDHSLEIGENITVQIKEKITACTLFMVLLTEESLESKWVLFEIGGAWILNKHIIPLLSGSIDDKRIPAPIKEISFRRIEIQDGEKAMLNILRSLSHKYALPLNESEELMRNISIFVNNFDKKNNNSKKKKDRKNIAAKNYSELTAEKISKFVINMD